MKVTLEQTKQTKVTPKQMAQALLESDSFAMRTFIEYMAMKISSNFIEVPTLDDNAINILTNACRVPGNSPIVNALLKASNEFPVVIKKAGLESLLYPKMDTEAFREKWCKQND